MSEHETKVSLDSFAGGALLERFNQELERVSTNVADPNTSDTAKREITIKLVFSPNPGGISVADYAVAAKLCPVNAGRTSMVFDYDYEAKKGIASEIVSGGVRGQMTIAESVGEVSSPAPSPALASASSAGEKDLKVIDYRRMA